MTLRGPAGAAQRALATELDLGAIAFRRLAILPADYNRDPEQNCGDLGRDIDDVMTTFVPAGRQAIFLVRPDRYTAAAAEPPGAAKIAERIRALIAATHAPL